jgi:site-specific DNA recombinase
MSRVALYFRVGNQNQLCEENLKRQFEILNMLAKRQQHIVVCSSYDIGSGNDFNRKGLQEIKLAAESGLIDTVLVMEITRIGRDYIKTHEYLQYLQKYNVRVLQAEILQ